MLRKEEQRHTFRLGTRHVFSPGFILLGSFTYQDFDTRFRTDDFPVGGFIDSTVPQMGFSGELQHLFRSRHLSLRTGAGYVGVDSKEDATIGSPGSEPFQSVTDQDLQHFNVYAYADVNLQQT